MKIDFNTRLHRESLSRIRKIARLRANGLTWTQIGRAMGFSRQRAQQLGTRVPKA